MNQEIELLSIPRSIELTNPALHDAPADDGRPLEQAFSLPAADGGKAAWCFLISSFVIEALVWGWPLSFGIFQNYYTHHEPFSSDASRVAAIGTSATGLMYMSPIVLMPIYSYWPHFRRTSAFVGIPFLAASLLAASFANSVLQLILSQGLCYGIGASLVYYPAFILIDEWFIRRKGFAFGIMWAGTGASGMTLPFLLSWTLDTFGQRITLRLWVAVVVVVASPLLYFIKPRLPISDARRARPLDLRFLSSRAFWIFMFGCTSHSLGFFLPGIYLPTMAQSYGATSLQSALTLISQNLAMVLGNPLIGALVDRFQVTSVMMLITIVTAAAVFLLWGFSQSVPLLIVFALAYGFSAGCFSASWSGIGKEIQSRFAGTDTTIVLGVLSVARGIGAVASGPLSAVLVRVSLGHAASSGYSSDYGRLIVFTGVTASAGSVAFFARCLGWM